jgi:transposase-like protein
MLYRSKTERVLCPVSFNATRSGMPARRWVHRARADRSQGRTGLTAAEREELSKLRKENRELQMERDIRNKAAAFFAKYQA